MAPRALLGLSTQTRDMQEALCASKAPYEKGDLMYMTRAVCYTLLPCYSCCNQDPADNNKYTMRLR